MRCCTNCFGDIGLSEIFPSLATEQGRCSYCDSTNALLAKPIDLFDIFSAVINIYEECEDGQSILYWLKDDWDLFTHPKMDDFRAKDLLTAILDDAEVVRRRYRPSDRFRSNRLEQWEKLTKELRSQNRYFPDVSIDFERMRQLLKFLRASSIPEVWFRARINESETPFEIKQMGAPPIGVASHGRANPPGIPYLYVGSTPETSISEIRPHTGEIATVAKFSLDPDGISLVDLRHPKRLISPFSLGDEDDIGALRGDIGFLQRLGSELTRPVRPQAAAVEYVPSQYLCEFIKKSGWDGVIYSSSVSDGINLALFNPAKAEAESTSVWSVDRVSVSISETI